MWCHYKCNCSDKSEWAEWLQFLSKFLSCYSVSSILLDTGSSITILGNNSHLRFLNQCNLSNQGYKLNKTPEFHLLAAGGQRMTTLGVLKLPITFQNQCHILYAHIVPEVQNELILGMDFWRIF